MSASHLPIATRLSMMCIAAWCSLFCGLAVAQKKGVEDPLDGLRASTKRYLDDVAEQFRLFKQAAEQGDKSAYSTVAWSYENGTGTEADPAQAAAWYQKDFTENQSGKAAYRLGLLYNGKLATPGSTEAMQWLEKAKQLGYPPPALSQHLARIAREPGRSDLRWKLVEYLRSDAAVFDRELLSEHAFKGFELRLAEDPAQDFHGARDEKDQVNRPQNYYADAENRPLNYVKALFEARLWVQTKTLCGRYEALERAPVQVRTEIVQKVVNGKRVPQRQTVREKANKHTDDLKAFRRYENFSLVELGRAKEAITGFEFREAIDYALKKPNINGHELLSTLPNVHLGHLDPLLLAKYFDAASLLDIATATHPIPNGPERAVLLCDQAIVKDSKLAAAYKQRAISRWEYLRHSTSDARSNSTDSQPKAASRITHTPEQVLEDCQRAIDLGVQWPDVEAFRATVTKGAERMRMQTAVASSIADLKTQVADLLKSGQYAQAKDHWDKLVAANPHDWKARRERLAEFERWDALYKTAYASPETRAFEYFSLLAMLPTASAAEDKTPQEVAELHQNRLQFYEGQVAALMELEAYDDALSVIDQWLAYSPANENFRQDAEGRPGNITRHYRGWALYFAGRHRDASMDVNFMAQPEFPLDIPKQRVREAALSDLKKMRLSPPGDKQIQRLKIDIAKLEGYGDLFAARKKQLELLKIHPDFKQAKQELARLDKLFVPKQMELVKDLLRAQKFDEALQEFEKVMEVMPWEPAIYQTQQEILSMMKRNNDLEQLVALDHGIALCAPWRLARIHSKPVLLDRQQTLNRLLTQRIVWYSINRNSKQVALQQALGDLERTLELPSEVNKRDWYLTKQCAELLWRAGEEDKANEYFQRAIALGLEADQVDLLKKIARVSAKLEPSTSAPVRFAATARLKLQQNDFRGAEFDARQGLEISATDPLFLSLVGRALFKYGKLDEAFHFLHKATGQKPTGENLEWLGDCELALGRSDAAVAAYKRAIELDASGATAERYAGLASACLASARYDEAEKHAMKAVTLEPKHARAHAIAGLAILGGNRAPFAAEQELHTALQLDAELGTWLLAEAVRIQSSYNPKLLQDAVKQAQLQANLAQVAPLLNGVEELAQKGQFLAAAVKVDRALASLTVPYPDPKLYLDRAQWFLLGGKDEAAISAAIEYLGVDFGAPQGHMIRYVAHTLLDQKEEVQKVSQLLLGEQLTQAESLLDEVCKVRKIERPATAMSLAKAEREKEDAEMLKRWREAKPRPPERRALVVVGRWQAAPDLIYEFAPDGTFRILRDVSKEPPPSKIYEYRWNLPAGTTTCIVEGFFNAVASDGVNLQWRSQTIERNVDGKVESTKSTFDRPHTTEIYVLSWPEKDDPSRELKVCREQPGGIFEGDNSDEVRRTTRTWVGLPDKPVSPKSAPSGNN